MPDEGSIRIAVADDERKICDLLDEVLSDEGYRVDTFSYSLDCLEALESGGYDLLITDLRMPVMDGLDLASRARKLCDDLVILVITGYASVDTAVEALRAGIDDYLLKPVDIDHLKSTVRRALQSRRARRRNEELVRRLRVANGELIRAKETLARQIARAHDHLNETSSTLKRRADELSILGDVSRVVTSMFDLERVLDLYIRILCDRIGIRNCSILLVDDETRELVVCASEGVEGAELLGQRAPVEAGIEGLVAQNRIPVLVDDLATDKRFRDRGTARYGRDTFLCAPLVAKGELLGVIDLNGKTDGSRFGEEDLNLLTAVAGQVSVAIDNARLYRLLQENSFRTVQALATTLEAKDRYTHGHSARVTDYALRVAGAMGLDEEQCMQLRYAGQLHDVGKIGVDEAILRKPAGLTLDERRAIQEHPVIGEHIIEPLDFLSRVKRLIRHHHERWDGKGYPDGLEGQDIPLLTQIMTVADAYDAMTSERPYRHAKSRPDALRELQRGRGSQFAPKVVDEFLHALSEPTSAAG